MKCSGYKQNKGINKITNVQVIMCETKNSQWIKDLILSIHYLCAFDAMNKNVT